MPQTQYTTNVENTPAHFYSLYSMGLCYLFFGYLNTISHVYQFDIQCVFILNKKRQLK
jgi:hypothetical protein